MKKIITTIIALCAIVSANAQFKVTSDGNVHIKDSLNDGHAILSIGQDPEATSSYYSGVNAATHIYSEKTTRSYNFGLFSQMYSQNNTQNNIIGVWGEVRGASGFHNFGVAGLINPYDKGAGIYGTNEGGIYPWATLGEYAGYFYGDVYVDGPLTAYSLYVVSDETRMANTTSLSATSSPTRGSTLDNLLSLDVKSYNLKQRDALTKGSDSQLSDAQVDHINQKEKEKSMQPHFGISAQELQKIYPELVMEGSDGTLMVNYVEMVPLLLRSIQELKAEVEELRAASDLHTGDDRNNTIAGGQTEEKATENQRLMLLK